MITLNVFDLRSADSNIHRFIQWAGIETIAVTRGTITVVALNFFHGACTAEIWMLLTNWAED